MSLIHECVEAISARVGRVSVVIKIDHRPGVGPGSMARKWPRWKAT
jgi:uncharacterized protein YqgV (UPF0045/DUF77 family)